MTVPACEASSGPNLGALLEGHASIPSGLDRIVTAVCDDSRAVAPGAVFFARRGLRVDGRRFAARAVASGAAAVVTGGEPAPARLDGGAVVVTVPDVAGALGHAASRFFADPSEHLSVAAVTGTNGKTSVTHLTARACGEERSAVMGTLGAGPLGRLEAVALTTPGPIEIHRRLAAMRDAGIDTLAMEVSSHALDQRRIEGVRVDTAVFTNLSRDHLDYHPDMGAYARAKTSLFDVPDLAHAVINVDDRVGRELIGTIPAGIESVGLTLADGLPATATAPIVAGRIVEQQPGLSLHVATPWGGGTLDTRLLGRFNAHNLLAAVAVACLHGHGLDAVLRRLRGAEPLAGRMQRLGGGSHPLVVVDYSHTPDALRNALAALRPLCARDAVVRVRLRRRAGPGQAAADGGGGRAGRRPGRGHRRQSPRRERRRDRRRHHGGVRPAGRGARRAGSRHRDSRCGDRSGRRDVVLLAGKGHETTQERDGVRLPFSDVASARHALGVRG